MGILGNFLGRIAGVIHENILRGDIDADGGLEAFDIEHAVFALELHQVQRRQVTSGVIDEDILTARVGAMDRFGAFAGVPFLDGSVVLEAGVAAYPGAFGDLTEQLGGILFVERFAGGGGAGPPFFSFHAGLHEFIADPDGEVLVLIHHSYRRHHRCRNRHSLAR